MISKKFIIFPIVLGATSTSLFLTSCAQVSQYEPRVILNIDDDAFKVNVNGNANSPKYSTLIGSQLSVQVQNNEGKWSNADVKKEQYFLPLSVNAIYPLITLTNKLVNVSHIPSEFSNPNSLFNNNLIFSNNNSLKEFLYASSNTLNQGRKNQIKLYLSEMNLTSVNGDSAKKLINDRTTETTLEVEKKPNKIKKNDKKDLWVYDVTSKNQKKVEDSEFVNNEYTLPYNGKAYESNSTKKFNISFKYNYFYPEDTSIYKSKITDLNVVKNYVKNNNAWNGLEPTNVDFTINLNIQAEIRTEYSFLTYLEVDKGKNELTQAEKDKLVAVTKNGSNGSEKYEIKLPKKDNNASNSSKEEYVNFSNFGVKFLPSNSRTNMSNSFLEDLKNNAGTNGEFKDNSSTLLSWLKEDKLPTNFYITSESQQKELVDKIGKFKNTLSF